MALPIEEAAPDGSSGSSRDCSSSNKSSHSSSNGSNKSASSNNSSSSDCSSSDNNSNGRTSTCGSDSKTWSLDDKILALGAEAYLLEAAYAPQRSSNFVSNIKATPPRCFYTALHLELQALLELLHPSAVEQHQRLRAAARLQLAAAAALPGSSCCVFGSQATQLALPGADLDAALCVPPSYFSVAEDTSRKATTRTTPTSNSSSSTVNASSSSNSSSSTVNASSSSNSSSSTVNASSSSNSSSNQNASSSSSSESISRAHVVTCLELLALSIQRFGLAQSLEVVSGARVPILRRFPVLRPLILCVKLLLKVLTPGLFCRQSQPRVLLSHLLMEFMHFFGIQWDVEAWGGCVRGGCHIFLKETQAEAARKGLVVDAPHPQRFCMESPLESLLSAIYPICHPLFALREADPLSSAAAEALRKAGVVAAEGSKASTASPPPPAGPLAAPSYSWMYMAEKPQQQSQLQQQRQKQVESYAEFWLRMTDPEE
ncbi:uncharacterized protein LOC113147049 [Cyclospora cayetanensis]|uniref:Uncharacterized protein LOC113147049 n=1 Tax=Cyclospora cayetanensis TaxID=88456 RepID=A0A6P6RVV4_9EIME|nr:uncharacterized protein LOC113147049 [Cyclospora cayetanensis]